MAKKKQYDFFKAFDKQLEIAEEEIEVLIETIETFTVAEDLKPLLEKAHEIEHRGDEVNREIQTNVSLSFSTPIDRGDIVELTQDLDDIIDKTEGIIQYFYTYNVQMMEPQALEFAQIVKKSLKALHKSVESFSHEFKRAKKIRAMVQDVHDLEEQADELYVETIRSLYTVSAANPTRLEVWSRLFDQLEATVDACEIAADTMAIIMLKNV